MFKFGKNSAPQRPLQAGNMPAPTAQTARQGVAPTTVMPQGVNPNFKGVMAFGPKYIGPGASPTGPINTAKVNEINNMLRGRPAMNANMKKGGEVKASSASKRADGCAIKGKTKGKMV
jgi:hypothetical protein